MIYLLVAVGLLFLGMRIWNTVDQIKTQNSADKWKATAWQPPNTGGAPQGWSIGDGGGGDPLRAQSR